MHFMDSFCTSGLLTSYTLACVKAASDFASVSCSVALACWERVLGGLRKRLLWFVRWGLR